MCQTNASLCQKLIDMLKYQSLSKNPDKPNELSNIQQLERRKTVKFNISQLLLLKLSS
ncbi:MAG: hypothetical protein JWQ27_631 [Ferruginibacter sp.]|nr:hypothetical protein [Ferruginibacter sp.]